MKTEQANREATRSKRSRDRKVERTEHVSRAAKERLAQGHVEAMCQAERLGWKAAQEWVEHRASFLEFNRIAALGDTMFEVEYEDDVGFKLDVFEETVGEFRDEWAVQASCVELLQLYGVEFMTAFAECVRSTWDEVWRETHAEDMLPDLQCLKAFVPGGDDREIQRASSRPAT